MATNMIIFLCAAIILNIYAYRGWAMILDKFKVSKLRKPLIYGYFLADALFIVFSVFWNIVIRTSQWHDFIKYRNYFYVSGAFALIYFPKFSFVPFVLLNDIKNLIAFALRFILKKSSKVQCRLFNLKYSKFILASGLFFSLAIFFFVVYGITIGKSNFKIREVEIYSEMLPDSFDGFVIAHISDTHLGSFSNKNKIIRGIEKIANSEPDVVLFTGDLINNQPEEGLPYINSFQELQPEFGKFSVLGNHDLGDYRRWYMIEEKMPDIKSLEKLHDKMGFKLLRNENAFVHKENDSIMIAGVDNWGLPPFEKAGDLSKAISPFTNFEFIILLTHDPTHWSEEILGNKNIRLTLSGHTHGLQFGIKIMDFAWSPIKYHYKHWYGIYEYNNQYLYVNPGFGFLGLPLRVGMHPEITLITLHKTKNN